MTTYEKNGKTFFKLHRDSFDLEIGKSQFQFDDLFPGNEELNEQTNKVINDSGDILVEDFKPIISDIIYVFGNNIANKVFEKYSLDQLFPEL